MVPEEGSLEACLAVTVGLLCDLGQALPLSGLQVS